MHTTVDLPKGDADADEPAFLSSRLATNAHNFEACLHTKPGRLWKQALAKLQSVDLDPWCDFPSHISARPATRHRYSAIKKKWFADEIQIRMEAEPFDRGAMRECFRLKKLSSAGTCNSDSSNYVAKRYINIVDKQVYFDDVRLQMEAKLWAEAFNRQNPPKKVDIFQLSVLELKAETVNPSVIKRSTGIGHDQTCQSEETNNDSSYATASTFYHIERFMKGEYRKYNSNSGFVDVQLRNTPQAFSHFTFERSGHRLLVVDIQGVGDLYTDPQIHTSDGIGYSDGNLGPKGMAFFFHSHRCNPLCEWLGLTAFDLAPREQAILNKSIDLAILAEHDNTEGIDQHMVAPIIHADNVNAHASLGQNSSPDWLETDFPTAAVTTGNGTILDANKQQKHVVSPPGEKSISRRRRCVSFNQSTSSVKSVQFGPTVTRLSPESSGRRRCTSGADIHPMHLSDAHISNAVHSSLFDIRLESSIQIGLGSGGSLCGTSSDQSRLCQIQSGLDLKQSYPRPVLAIDALSFKRTQQSRTRAASGDSGYYGPMNTNSAAVFDLDIMNSYKEMHLHFTGDCVDVDHVQSFRSRFISGSSSSLLDFSVPTSPAVAHASYLNGQSLESSLNATCDDLLSSFPLAQHNGGSSFCGNLNPSAPLANVRVGGAFKARRHRNLSESSDIDVEEGHRLAGNLLHQLMHESHKPSCAGHPTNLDQEIGQSILGQIHHELARLHESGRFLPNCTGGWSYAGLGGLLLKHNEDDADEEDDEDDNIGSVDASQDDSPSNETDSVSLLTDSEHSIDWTAVLFHEQHAAQLGCLEAMIDMAHHYLGLPTQLLHGCPIEINQSNLRSGVDYLWRAAEGGDRRCMILLARYLDVSATLMDSSCFLMNDSKPSDFLILPILQAAKPDTFPSVTLDAWAEAITWYQKAVDCAGTSVTAPDEGLDAEGRYDAAEDLLPVYRIVARMAELYACGGFGLTQDYSMAGDLFNQAGELASNARQGRLAVSYFERAEEVYAKVD